MIVFSQVKAIFYYLRQHVRQLVINDMIYLIATFFFILLQAFYSGVETGLISIQKPRVRLGITQGYRNAKILDFFLERPGLMLSTCLVGTNICVVCASVMAKNTAAVFGFDTSSGLVATTVIMTSLLLTAEIIPKNWFRQLPYQRCMLFAPLLYGSLFFLYPGAKLMALFTEWIGRIISGAPDPDMEPRNLMREDLRLLLKESEAANIIDSEAADILDRSIDFHSAKIGEIMVPRKKVMTLTADTTVADAVAFCHRNKVSRVPVSTTNPKRAESHLWVGVFSVYDAFFNLPEKRWTSTTVGKLLRPLSTIAANDNLTQVLVKAKRSHSKSPMLIVVSPKDPNKQLGLATPIDVVKKIFGSDTTTQ